MEAFDFCVQAFVVGMLVIVTGFYLALCVQLYMEDSRRPYVFRDENKESN